MNYSIVKFIFGSSAHSRLDKFYNRDLLDRTGHIYWNIMFKTFVLLWRHPAGAFFPPKTAFPNILDMVIFSKNEFSSKLNCWVTYSERYLIKVVRMDRTGHLGFR